MTLKGQENVSYVKEGEADTQAHMQAHTHKLLSELESRAQEI